jgi:hypothetical protein
MFLARRSSWLDLPIPPKPGGTLHSSTDSTHPTPALTTHSCRAGTDTNVCVSLLLLFSNDEPGQELPSMTQSASVSFAAVPTNLLFST